MQLIDKVKYAMLAVQRMPREQGVAAQALLELGETELVIALVHEAVQKKNGVGLLSVFPGNTLVTDSGAIGEAVWRAYQMTDNEMYRDAAMRMLEYYLIHAPHTEDGIVFHSTAPLHKGFTARQLWAESCYTLPPFLAMMNETIEAVKQLVGYMCYLRDEETGLLYHIYDAGKKEFVNKKLWATGNGYALLGIARVLSEAKKQGEEDTYVMLRETGFALLDSMLKFQCEDGLFYDTLNDPKAFKDGTSAMMAAAFIYRSIREGWLDKGYKKYADTVRKTMRSKVNTYGIVRGVCGAPDFKSEGTSCEAQAAYIMMEAWKDGK